MKTKLFFISLSILLLSAPGIQSCKKYPEGPALSLRSKTERISNTWKIENYSVNGADLTSLVSNYTETFTKDNNYSYSWGIINGTGTWAFQNNKMEVKLIGNESFSSRTLIILKLEEKTLWYYYMDGTDKNEVHLIQN
jgi:hypothetical protein